MIGNQDYYTPNKIEENALFKKRYVIHFHQLS